MNKRVLRMEMLQAGTRKIAKTPFPGRKGGLNKRMYLRI